MTYVELLAALAATEGVSDAGRRFPVFRFGGKLFLHFHLDDGVLSADVRFAKRYERAAAATPAEREALLARVRAHVAARRT